VAADRCYTGLSTVDGSACPPVDGRHLGDHVRGGHHVPEVAEPPQLLGGAAVLEEILIFLEGVELPALNRSIASPTRLISAGSPAWWYDMTACAQRDAQTGSHADEA
jgi:hypothetical protein